MPQEDAINFSGLKANPEDRLVGEEESSGLKNSKITKKRVLLVGTSAVVLGATAAYFLSEDIQNWVEDLTDSIFGASAEEVPPIPSIQGISNVPLEKVFETPLSVTIQEGDRLMPLCNEAVEAFDKIHELKLSDSDKAGSSLLCVDQITHQSPEIDNPNNIYPGETAQVNLTNMGEIVQKAISEKIPKPDWMGGSASNLMETNPHEFYQIANPTSIVMPHDLANIPEDITEPFELRVSEGDSSFKIANVLIEKFEAMGHELNQAQENRLKILLSEELMNMNSEIRNPNILREGQVLDINLSEGKINELVERANHPVKAPDWLNGGSSDASDTGEDTSPTNQASNEVPTPNLDSSVLRDIPQGTALDASFNFSPNHTMTLGDVVDQILSQGVDNPIHDTALYDHMKEEILQQLSQNNGGIQSHQFIHPGETLSINLDKVWYTTEVQSFSIQNGSTIPR